jgi:hypothetical protein
MNPRHAAALALIDWYPMLPPTGRDYLMGNALGAVAALTRVKLICYCSIVLGLRLILVSPALFVWRFHLDDCAQAL